VDLRTISATRPSQRKIVGGTGIKGRPLLVGLSPTAPGRAAGIGALEPASPSHGGPGPGPGRDQELSQRDSGMARLGARALDLELEPFKAERSGLLPV